MEATLTKSYDFLWQYCKVKLVKQSFLLQLHGIEAVMAFS